MGRKVSARKPDTTTSSRFAGNRGPTQTPQTARRPRSDQAVKLIEKSPGINASEVAKTLKIKPNYLYRVLGDLEKEVESKSRAASASLAAERRAVKVDGLAVTRGRAA